MQANGIGRDFLDDNAVYIFDMYNRSIYPQDGYAKSVLRFYAFHIISITGCSVI